MTPVPDKYLNLFQKRALASLATLMPDGSPQVTVVWVDYDGEHILINTARERVKERNMRARPQVAMVIVDPDSVHRYLLIRGRVVSATEEGADAHIDRLSARYTGRQRYAGHRNDIKRVIFKIAPEQVKGAG